MSYVICKHTETKDQLEKQLFIATETKNIKALYKLLQKGVSPNCCDEKQGKTPLVFACCYGDVTVARILISHGACVNISGNEPMIVAIKHGHCDIVNLLLEKGSDKDVQFRCPDLDVVLQPIHYACVMGQVEILEILVKYNCNLESVCQNGRRPIHYAVRYNRRAIIKSLSDNNADLEARDNQGNTPLHLAVSGNQYATVECLINLDVDTGIRNSDNKSVLDIATEKEFNRILKLLNRKISEDTKSKTSVEALDFSNSTPVSAASNSGFPPPDVLHEILGFMRTFSRCSGIHHDTLDAHTPTSDYVSYGGSQEGLTQRGYAGRTQPKAADMHGRSLPNIAYAMEPYSIPARSNSAVVIEGHYGNQYARIVREKFGDLMSNMRAEDIMPKLFAKRVLSRSVYEKLREKCQTPTERNEVILMGIMAGPEEHYKVFVDALRETNQDHLAHLIDPLKELESFHTGQSPFNEAQRALPQITAPDNDSKPTPTIDSTKKQTNTQLPSTLEDPNATSGIRSKGQQPKSSQHYTRKKRAEKQRSHLDLVSSDLIGAETQRSYLEWTPSDFGSHRWLGRDHETRKSCPANLNQTGKTTRLSMPNAPASDPV